MIRKIKSKAVPRDPKKECNFKALVAQLAELGVSVRRERLKQGFGWKAMSGSCQLAAQGIVLVDSRLSQDEQITFLSEQLKFAQARPISTASPMVLGPS